MCGRKKKDFCITIQFSVSLEFFQNNRVSLWPQDWPQDFLPNPLITAGTSCLHSQLFNDFVLATGRVGPQVWTGGGKKDFWIAIQFSMNLLLWTALICPSNLSHCPPFLTVTLDSAYQPDPHPDPSPGYNRQEGTVAQHPSQVRRGEIRGRVKWQT